MCGIAGFYDLSQQNITIKAALLAAMQKKLAHRGPDGYGIWKSDEHSIGLAHRRLAIIDVSQAGCQPMIDKKNTVIISFNGEIYNHQKLRKELEFLGYTYFSNTDTETILYAYKEWGIECLSKLDGMFAFALFDLNKKELYLVRDRIGVKPLYFSIQNNILSFSSEIKALWELPWNHKSISNIAMYHYLTFMVTPAPYTLFEKIYKLPAGFYAKIDSKKNISFYEWYTPLKTICPKLQHNMMSEEFCIKHITNLLINSTKKRMMADVPFGAFLSGGIDSSLNVALMSKYINNVKTFTVAFDGDKENNELFWAKQVSQQFDTNHHEIIISEKEAFEFYKKMVYHLDEPLADCVCIPFYHVAKLARDAGVKVVQVGEGADELFFGYPTYARYEKLSSSVLQPAQRYMPLFMQKSVLAVSRFFFSSQANLIDLVKNWSKGRPVLWGGAIAFNETQKELLLKKDFFELSYDSIIEKIYKGIHQDFDSFLIVDYHMQHLLPFFQKNNFFKHLLYLELKQRLPELLLMRTDKMSMATGVEARVPFLDHKLVEFVLHIPSSLLYKNNTTKYLLKRVAEQFLPHKIIHRKKVGFAAPTHQWLSHGKYFPAYFDQINKKQHFYKDLFKKQTWNRNNQKHCSSVQAVQEWVLQNLWATL
jgi:asparagine synthase (glutamine-hydrolysing)